MTDLHMPLTADADYDDLPRTLRREREARAREARERETRERAPEQAETAPPYLAWPKPTPVLYGDDPLPATVRRFDVPFFSLMAFFLKAVLAAVPALIVLGVMLWFAGKGLQAYFPELVRMKIVISLPNA